MWHVASWPPLHSLYLCYQPIGASSPTCQLFARSNYFSVSDLNLTKELRAEDCRWEKGAKKATKSDNFSENGSANEGKRVRQGIKSQIVKQKWLLYLARGKKAFFKGKGKKEKKWKFRSFVEGEVEGMGMGGLLPLLVTTITFLAKVFS